MADVVSICNLALSYLGDAANVVSIDAPEKSTQAKLCRRLYPMAVSALLDMHDWSFATKRKAVPELVDEEGFGWRKVFQLPADSLRAISVKEYRYQSVLRHPFAQVFPDHDPTQAEFEVKDGKIYSNVENAVVQYVSSNTDVSRFTPGFVVALAYFLAHQLVGARVKGKEGQTLAQALFKQFQVSLSIAKTKDASQEQKRIHFVPSWIKAR